MLSSEQSLPLPALVYAAVCSAVLLWWYLPCLPSSLVNSDTLRKPEAEPGKKECTGHIDSGDAVLLN